MKDLKSVNAKPFLRWLHTTQITRYRRQYEVENDYLYGSKVSIYAIASCSTDSKCGIPCLVRFRGRLRATNLLSFTKV